MPIVPTTRPETRPATAAPAAPAPAGVVAPPEQPANGVGFFLFLLVNAALFVRPTDVVPDLQGVEVYQYLILACLAISFPAVLAQLAPSRLERSPVLVCILLLLPVMVVSLLIQSRRGEAFDEGFRFFKVLVYLLLLVALITTPKRMKILIGCLIFYTSITTLLSILDFHHEYTDFKLVRPQFDIHGQPMKIEKDRMYGPGIFADPNDICVIISASVMLLLGILLDSKRSLLFRVLWVFPLAVFGYGFYLTQSRGGLLALMAGGGVMIVLRWGWSKALLLGGMALPALLFMVAGRMTAISSETNTGQARIELWNAGLVMLKDNPIFGVGQNRFHLEATQVAHNSYIQQYGDTGFPGGTLYLGAVVLSLWSMWQVSAPVSTGRQPVPRTIIDPEYRHLYPFLAGALASYSMGMMTLSMNLLVTTYTFLGLSAVFLQRAKTNPPQEEIKFDMALLVRLGLLSMAFVIGMFIFVRVTFRP